MKLPVLSGFKMFWSSKPATLQRFFMAVYPNVETYFCGKIIIWPKRIYPVTSLIVCFRVIKNSIFTFQCIKTCFIFPLTMKLHVTLQFHVIHNTLNAHIAWSPWPTLNTTQYYSLAKPHPSPPFQILGCGPGTSSTMSSCIFGKPNDTHLNC